MSKSNTFETDFLELIFNGSAIADLAENDSSTPATDLYVSLHTADPTESGNQQSSEATYGSYARVAVARNSGGWTVSNGTVENTADIVFPECDSGSNTVSHIGIGTALSGAGYLLFYGQLSTPLNISTGIEPRFSAGDLQLTED